MGACLMTSFSRKPVEIVSAALEKLVCVKDYERLAKEILPPDVWAYLNAGAADGITNEGNQRAFQAISLLPRVLGKVANGSTAMELFGYRYAHPVFIAPMAYHGLAHQDAELATAVAASAMKAAFVVSTQASVSLEEIAENAQCPLWFQLYMQPQREISLDLVRRAELAGYQAIVVTVDAPIQGLRNEDQRQGFHFPDHLQPVNLSRYAGSRIVASIPAGGSLFSHPLIETMATWEDISWLVAHTKLPVLLKGILHPLDVQPALDAGAAGIIVSNHGGRVLDTTPPMPDILPKIASEIKGRVPILADGGIRRGTDIIKALALGADAVLIGRPVMHGLAAAGATGVAHVLNLLRMELEAAMVLTGCRTLADIDATRLAIKTGNTVRY